MTSAKPGIINFYFRSLEPTFPPGHLPPKRGVNLISSWTIKYLIRRMSFRYLISFWAGYWWQVVEVFMDKYDYPWRLSTQIQLIRKNLKKIEEAKALKKAQNQNGVWLSNRFVKARFDMCLVLCMYFPIQMNAVRYIAHPIELFSISSTVKLRSKCSDLLYPVITTLSSVSDHSDQIYFLAP